MGEGKSVVDEVVAGADALLDAEPVRVELMPGKVATIRKLGVRQALTVAKLIKPGVVAMMRNMEGDSLDMLLEMLTAIEPDDAMKIISVLGRVEVGPDDDIDLETARDFLQAWLRVNSVESLKNLIASSLQTAD